MFVRNGLSRRGFVGGVASALGYLTLQVAARALGAGPRRHDGPAATAPARERS